MGYIANPELDQITASKFAVDGQVEQCQLTDAIGLLEPNPDCPDFLKF
jgi:hypothetical protein